MVYLESSKTKKTHFLALIKTIHKSINASIRDCLWICKSSCTPNKRLNNYIIQFFQRCTYISLNICTHLIYIHHEWRGSTKGITWICKVPIRFNKSMEPSIQDIPNVSMGASVDTPRMIGPVYSRGCLGPQNTKIFQGTKKWLCSCNNSSGTYYNRTCSSPTWWWWCFPSDHNKNMKPKLGLTQSKNTYQPTKNNQPKPYLAWDS